MCVNTNIVSKERCSKDVGDRNEEENYGGEDGEGDSHRGTVPDEDPGGVQDEVQG